MQCKNCQKELLENSKYCPECGASIKDEPKQDKSDEAMKLLKDIDARTKKLEDAREEKRKKKEALDAERKAASTNGRKGILDIF